MLGTCLRVFDIDASSYRRVARIAKRSHEASELKIFSYLVSSPICGFCRCPTHSTL